MNKNQAAFKANKYLNNAICAFADCENTNYDNVDRKDATEQAIAAAVIAIAQELKRFNDRVEAECSPPASE